MSGEKGNAAKVGERTGQMGRAGGAMGRFVVIANLRCAICNWRSGDDGEGFERLGQCERNAFVDERSRFNFSMEFGFQAVEEFVDEAFGGAGTSGDEDGVGIFQPMVIQITRVIN